MRRLQLVVVALLVGTPAVWATIRHVKAHEASDLLRSVATAHQRVSYAGKIQTRRHLDKSADGAGRSAVGAGGSAVGAGRSADGADGSAVGAGGSKRKHSWSGRGKSMSVRHDAASGCTAYRFRVRRSGGGRSSGGREFVISRPSSRLQDPGGFCLAPDALVANYRAEELPPREFLGRRVRVLRALPRIEGRPSIEIWADATSHLPLKVTTFRADGSVYRASEYTEIEFAPQEIAERRLRKTHAWIGAPVPKESPAESAGFRPLLPDYLPPGFELVEARVRERATVELSLLYSDGATFFQIKQSPAATPAMVENYLRQRMGESRVRRIMAWKMRKNIARLAKAGSQYAGSAGERTAVRCRKHESKSHMTLKLDVDDIDIEVTARRDIDAEAVLSVVRSLKR